VCLNCLYITPAKINLILASQNQNAKKLIKDIYIFEVAQRLLQLRGQYYAGFEKFV